MCERDCKGDAGGRSLVPALKEHGASILTECEVLEIIADGTHVSHVRVNRKGVEMMIGAKAVVLGAGSYMTPKLLLNSQSSAWPDGLANRSGFVGRNMMLHTSDFLTIDHRDPYSSEGPRKSLSLNDFYFDDGKKLGTLQAVGQPLVPPLILDYLRFAEVRDPHWWRTAVSRFLPNVASLASKVFSTSYSVRHRGRRPALPGQPSRAGLAHQQRGTV